MVLDGAYHMGAFVGAVCTPSRHMIMSGRTVWHLPIGPGANGDCPPGPRHETRWPPSSIGPATRRCGPARTATATRGPTSSSPFARRPANEAATTQTGSAWHAEQVLDYLEPARGRSGRPAVLDLLWLLSPARHPRRQARACSPSTARSITPTRTRCPPRIRSSPHLPVELPAGPPVPARPPRAQRRGGRQRRLDEPRRADHPQRARPRVRLFGEHRHPDRPRPRPARRDGRAGQHLHRLHLRPRHRHRSARSSGEAESLRAHLAGALHRQGPRHPAGLAGDGEHLSARRARDALRPGWRRRPGVERGPQLQARPGRRSGRPSATFSTASTAAARSRACGA